MKLLVIGSGGREHAMAWRLAQTQGMQKVFVAPGNAGTAREAELENVNITDPEALADFAEQNKVHLTVVGPEAPLAAGVVNVFRARGLKIFGPTKEAAQLEFRVDRSACLHRPAGCADRHQGRRPGRRQGRRRRHEP